VSDLLRIIDWLEYYVHQMSVLGHPDLRFVGNQLCFQQTQVYL
jgi:hypothetical protein